MEVFIMCQCESDLTYEVDCDDRDLSIVVAPCGRCLAETRKKAAAKAAKNAGEAAANSEGDHDDT